MAPKDDGTEITGRTSRWVKSNLVALGSAAVLAVYSAGYARTQSAAERFADEPTGRRPSERRATNAGPAAQLSHSDASVGAPVDTSRIIDSAPVSPEASAPVAVEPAPKRSEKAVAKDTTPTVAKVADSATVTAAPPVAPSPAAAPAVAVPAPATPTTPPVDSAAKTADTAHVQLKDGTFSGWGTSRHGDIEAAVQIKDGHIVSAFIVQCLTRYSCSWISLLPPQVVARQSAEVDYVSGATQSSNAFYYAIVEALSKAK